MKLIDCNSYPTKEYFLYKNYCKCARFVSVWLFAAIGSLALAQRPATIDPPEYGPYNGDFIADGPGLHFPIWNGHDTVLLADSPWSIYCWIRPNEIVKSQELVAGTGNGTAKYPRFFAFAAKK